jgi:hypothetical protein
MAKEPTEIKKLQRELKLPAADFSTMASVYSTMFARVPMGTTDEDLERPEFWAHVAQRCPKEGRVYVKPKDGGWVAELEIRLVTGTGVVMQVLTKHELAPISYGSVMSEYLVAWLDNTEKFQVIRLSDKVVMETGFNSQEDANDWISRNTQRAA